MARLFAGVEPGQRIRSDDQPPASVHRVDVDDPSGNDDRPEAPLQHRRLALPGGFADQRKAGGERGERQCRFAQRGMTAQREHQTARGNRGHEAEPQRGLDRERKVDPDSGAEKDRQP